MARAIFKSWFVDFDPVRAKAEGRDSGLPKHITDLFPDRLEDSELGKIPAGWNVEAIGDHVQFVKGRSYRSKDLQDSGTALVTLKSFARGGGYRADGLKPYCGDYKPEQLIYPGELVVACTDVTQAAEVIGRPAVVHNSSQYTTLVASLDTLIARPRNKSLSIPFLYGIFESTAFTDHTYAHTTGTTVLHLAKGAVESYRFTMPPEKLLEVYNDVIGSLFQSIYSNEAQNVTLAHIRSALLPQLISGELGVSDAQQIVEKSQ